MAGDFNCCLNLSDRFPASARSVCLFGVLRRFQHCTGHITTGSWKGRGNQYIEFARVLYCKLPTNGKQLPAVPLQAMTGWNPGLRGGRRECYHSATVAPSARSDKSVKSFANLMQNCKLLDSWLQSNPTRGHGGRVVIGNYITLFLLTQNM